MRYVLAFLIGCSGDIKVDATELVEGEGWRREVTDGCILEYDQTWVASEVVCDDCEFVAEVTWDLNLYTSGTSGCGEFYAEKHETVGYRLDERSVFADSYWVTEPGTASWEDGIWSFGNTSYDWSGESPTVVSTVYETAIFYGE